MKIPLHIQEVTEDTDLDALAEAAFKSYTDAMSVGLKKHTPGDKEHEQDRHGDRAGANGDDEDERQPSTQEEPFASPFSIGGDFVEGAGDGTALNPFHTSDVKTAMEMLLTDQHVRLEAPDQAATLLEDLRDMVNEAKAQGELSQNFDLCKVSLSGTNLFCGDHVGLERVEMPQLAGPSLPGSVASQYIDPAFGEANIGPLFMQHLTKDLQIDATPEVVLASHLKASQMELIGPKVIGIAGAMETGTLPDSPIFISQDGYVLDGHHRWAATIASDLFGDQDLGDLSMNVVRIDIPISQLIPYAKSWAEEQGMISQVAAVGKRRRRMKNRPLRRRLLKSSIPFPEFYTQNNILYRKEHGDIERLDGDEWIMTTLSSSELEEMKQLSDKDAIKHMTQPDTVAKSRARARVTKISTTVQIAKRDDYENLVFGWANVAFTPDGTQVEDHQSHLIDVEDLESAAYNFVIKDYGSGDMHSSDDYGELVESMVFTKEKMDLLGIKDMPQGWWVGFKIPPDEHKKVRDGKRTMFSIEGSAKLQRLDE